MSRSHLVQSPTLCKGAMANQTLRQLQAVTEILKSGNIRKQLTAAVAAGGGSCSSCRVLVHTAKIAASESKWRSGRVKCWKCGKWWSHSGKTDADLISDFSKMNFLKWCRDKSSSLISAATFTSQVACAKRHR